MDRGDFLCRVRRQWDLIADDTAAVLLAVTDPMEGEPMYVYTSKAMWMRTSVELRKLHPHERAAMMDATFKVSAVVSTVISSALSLLACFLLCRRSERALSFPPLAPRA